MKQFALSVEQLREIDRRCVEEYGIPTLLLMENAGLRTADIATQMVPSDSLVVCVCGAGSNGGDGFVAARHLSNRKFVVRIALVGQISSLQPTSAAAINFQIVRRMGIPAFHIISEQETKKLEKEFAGAFLIIDSLCGIGLKGELRPLQQSCVNAINLSGCKVLSVDVPSGLDADRGVPLPVAVKATKTVTFVASKKGFLEPQAKQYTGEVLVADIGVPYKLLKEYEGD
ncbi:MAG: NAD(P)H-hydrate epimerase [Planctomycetota bacterium]|nr:NAD(P)H-hydrate epimerase [Planctomycetota bacterium]